MIGSTIELVPDLDIAAYLAAAQAAEPGRRRIPLLGGAPAPPTGFPRDTAFVSADAPCAATRDAADLQAAPDRWILCLTEPHCAAVATLLARATGRSLALADASAWNMRLAALLEPGNVVSLALVVPGWDAAMSPDPRWLRLALASARRHFGQLRDIAWGIVTAPDPAALSRMAAKAIAQPEIVAHYAQAPTALFTSDAVTDDRARIPLAHPDERAPIQLIERSLLRASDPVGLFERSWSLLYFMGHGRSYCACEGHLCGARPVAMAAGQPIARCIRGMDCASPFDGALGPGSRAFPRIDPRRYDTPVMALASCGSGGWYDEDWTEGHSSLALLALAGAPGFVLTNDYTTIEEPAAWADMLYALQTAATLGVALSILNRRRLLVGGAFPFYLLGDPEAPAGRERWPDWVTDAAARPLPSQGATVWQGEIDLPPGRGFRRIALPSLAAEPLLTYVGLPEGRCGDALLFRESGGDELWVNMDGGAEPLTLIVRRCPVPALPDNLVRAAERLPTAVLSWAEALRPGATQLLEAAGQLVRADRLLRGQSGRAGPVEPEQYQGVADRCAQAWLDGHLACVAQSAALADGGLWPFRLWEHADHRAGIVADRCPYCGEGPTLMRSYASPPAGPRVQWECVRCALIEDRPLSPLPDFRLEVPDRVRTGEVTEMALHLDNMMDDPNGRIAVAGLLIFDQKGHGVEPPRPFAFELKAGDRHVERVILNLAKRPPVQHRYYLRCLMMIDGSWVMATRMVILSD